MTDPERDDHVVDVVDNFIPLKEYKSIHQRMPIVCVDMVVKYKRGLVVVKRAEPPEKDKWWFVGGRLHRGEDYKTAIERILKRETGLELKEFSLMGVENQIYPDDPFGHGQGTHSISIIFLVEAEGTFKMDETISDFRIIRNHNTGGALITGLPVDYYLRAMYD